jgi:hypothetical protein
MIDKIALPEILVSNYAYIRTQDRNIIKFEPYPWQKDFLKLRKQYKQVIINKSRDIGSSTIAILDFTARALLFGGDFLIASYKKGSSDFLFETAQLFLQKLKEQMREYKEFSNLSPYFELEEDTKHSLIIKSTGSHIKAMEMTEKVGRSFRYKYALFTEIAHWQNPRDSYKALTGAGVANAEEVIESTRNVDEPEGELFDELLENPDYYKLEYGYEVNPAHNAEWERIKRGKLTPREFAQEFEHSGEKSASGNLVIPLDAYRRAVNRDMLEGFPVELGVDVARYGDDESVITIRKGNKTEPQIIFKHTDLMQLADEVYAIYMNKKATAAKVDAIGIGAGVVDALKRKKDMADNVIEVNESQSPVDETYQNARAEMYFNIREKAMNDEISIPDDPELKTEFSYTHYKTNSQMRIQIEAKDEIKKKLKRSPDRADSLALAFYKGRTDAPSIFFA